MQGLAIRAAQHRLQRTAAGPLARRHDLPYMCYNCEEVSPVPPLPLSHSVRRQRHRDAVGSAVHCECREMAFGQAAPRRTKKNRTRRNAANTSASTCRWRKQRLAPRKGRAARKGGFGSHSVRCPCTPFEPFKFLQYLRPPFVYRSG
jgi:hypothetical protein